jgi:sugar phosphate isomerase/epimerase
VRFAVFTVSLPEWTPAEAVGHLSALGYDGVEWRVTDQAPVDGPPGFWSGNRCTWPLATLLDDAPRIRALAKGAGLDVPNLGTYVSSMDVHAVERAMLGAAAIGAPSIRVQVPNYDGRDPYLPLRDRALASFDAVTALAERHSIRALVEIHMRTIVPSASAAIAFCRSFDPAHLGVIHDAGNMVYEGFENYRMGLELLGPYLAHVHLKNARWTRAGTRDDGSTRWAAEFAPLTEGCVDAPALFWALAAVGYDGWLSFEDFSTAQPLLARTRDNLAYVKMHLPADGSSSTRPAHRG